jgi:UDP-N-acetylmuramyl tripeptide synthase
VPELTFAQIASMTGGQLIQGGDVVTSSVVIDSREVKPDSAFFAIKGERLDGHQFLGQALQTARGSRNRFGSTTNSRSSASPDPREKRRRRK